VSRNPAHPRIACRTEKTRDHLRRAERRADHAPWFAHGHSLHDNPQVTNGRGPNASAYEPPGRTPGRAYTGLAQATRASGPKPRRHPPPESKRLARHGGLQLGGPSPTHRQPGPHCDRRRAALRHLFNRLLDQLFHCLHTDQTLDPIKAFTTSQPRRRVTAHRPDPCLINLTASGNRRSVSSRRQQRGTGIAEHGSVDDIGEAAFKGSSEIECS
jgi:hypothetical protein